MAIEMQPGETLLREGAANLQRGIEAVGGRLYLTDRRLSFHSHAFNVQTGVTDIPLSQVRGTHPCWTKFLGMIPLFPTSLAVSTADGGQYHFVVHDRDVWAAVIGAKLPGAGG
ncbi:GRAM domain-containing protein [Stenotrophomonas nitritireducens]|uniref:GRAM domain-containing protein n=1 Tax=Stenotrophomonas nitritireducens TaxID=83617 RepID=UPI003CCFE67A